MIYLASPYTDESPYVREDRYLRTLAFAERKIRQGFPVFSPIVYGHPMEQSIGTTFLDWKPFNNIMLAAANTLWVLKLSGWERSRGVHYEIETADFHGLDISYFDPED